MIGNKYWEKKGCRRSDDKITAVVTLEVNTFPVHVTIDGLFALSKLYNKHSDACVAFNTSARTGHYMAKNSKKLAKLTHVKKSDMSELLDGQQRHDTYTFVRVADILPVLDELLNSEKLEVAYREAAQQETIAHAGDIAYKISWASLFNGRWYSYYNDPAIQRQRVTSAYTKMAGNAAVRPKKKVLK